MPSKKRRPAQPKRTRSSARRKTSPPSARKRVKPTFIDLFAGIGGMRSAFESAGGTCVYTSEYDAYAQRTYMANFDGPVHGDITRSTPSRSRTTTSGRGFPLSFSIAGVPRRRAAAPTASTIHAGHAAFNVKEIIREAAGWFLPET
jgi:DNA (cytosine-5)-methyltransferase 1